MASSEAASVVPYLIGGGLALAGTLTSQIFGLVASRLDRSHQTRLRRKQQLEKMVDLISQTQPWYFQLRRCVDISQIQATPPPLEARRVVMLARLSFPAIVDIAIRWSNGQVQYYHFACDCFQQGKSGTLGAHIAFAVTGNPTLKEFEEAPTILRNLLDDAIAEEAKKYREL